MKQLRACFVLAALVQIASFGQTGASPIEGKAVAKNDDVVFHQIDEHTWVGTGHLMSNESLYLVEGNDKAVLIDAGTRIADLDKIVASITKKPVMLVATHAHPDHTGSAIHYFPELYINPGDAASSFVANYKGSLRHLKDGETIDLGGERWKSSSRRGIRPAPLRFSIRMPATDSAAIHSAPAICFCPAVFPRSLQLARRRAR